MLRKEGEPVDIQEINKTNVLNDLRSRHSWAPEDITFDEANSFVVTGGKDCPYKCSWGREFVSCALVFAKKDEEDNAKILLDKAMSCSDTGWIKEEMMDIAMFWIILGEPNKAKEVFKNDPDGLVNIIKINKQLGVNVTEFKSVIDKECDGFINQFNDLEGLVKHNKEIIRKAEDDIEELKEDMPSWSGLMYLLSETVEIGDRNLVENILRVIRKKGVCVDRENYSDFIKIVDIKNKLGLGCASEMEDLRYFRYRVDLINEIRSGYY